MYIIIHICIYIYIYIYVLPTVHAPYGGSVLARLILGDLDSGSEGAENAKRDETPRSIHEGPLATA